VAVAHSLLHTTYHVLAEMTDYREPGTNYYDRRQRPGPHAAPSLNWSAWGIA
jgi:hypothetical protein